MDRLAAMQTFVRVLETGSFSAAAREMSVGQPAVSKTVAQLEHRLGVRLLSRTTRGLSPTEAGQRFYDRAKRTIEEAEAAELAARGAGAGLTGRLRVCAPVTFARLHIVPHLSAFMAAHPGLTMDVALDDRPIDLVEAGADLGLRVGTLPDSSLTARKLATGARLVLAAPTYLERHGVPATPAALAEHPAVIHTQSQCSSESWSFRQGARDMSANLSGPFRVSAAEGVRAAVLAGMGLTIASEWMFAPELASGAVRPVLTDWVLPSTALWAVYPSGRRPSAKAQRFATFVEATLKRTHSAAA